MQSPKQKTQKRMLSSKNNIINTKLANIASRSPSTKNPANISSKKTLPTQQDMNSSSESASKQKFNSFSKQVILSENQPLRTSQNLSHDEISFENGDRYEGGLRDQKFFGKGIYYYLKSNLKYEGEFQNNKHNGWGCLMRNQNHSDNVIYEGSWLNGQKHGQGKYYYGLDHFYTGEWEFDQKSGKGIYQYGEGLYNGAWKNNKRHGNGSLKLKNGTQFKGIFDNDYFVRGLIRYPNGDEYSGDLYYGKRQGEGSYFCLQKNQRYKGQWKDDIKNGKGSIVFSNGDQFTGIFKNGSVDQSMTCTYKWKNGSIFSGWFKNGIPEKGHVKNINGQQYDTS